MDYVWESVGCLVGIVILFKFFQFWLFPRKKKDGDGG